MMRSLSIRDFVIVDRMELEFHPGFTVLTGETGAGKSILVEALAAVLGERADPLLVRRGAARAEVSAEFAVPGSHALARWLAANELAADAGECVLRRVIEAEGRSRAFLNGRPVTLQQLREAAEFLVDIHGQHEHQSLLRPAAQRELLDAYGGLGPAAARVQALYRAWRERREARLGLESGAAALAAERETLEWQVAELEALRLAPGEWPELVAEHGRLAHAAALIEAARAGVEALSEGDHSGLAQLNAVVGRLASLAAHDARLREVLELLEPARIQLQEAVYQLRRYGERLELDPARLREVEQRLDAVHAAARKHRVEPEQLPARLEALRARLRELAEEADLEAVRRLEEEARAACLGEARALSAGRAQAARALAAEVTRAMQKLALQGGRFEVVLQPLAEPAAHGLETVEFRVATHPGATPLPLARVASGGELSRLSLAVQSVTAEVAQVPTLVFDEVDAGIGGRVAAVVGRMLHELGRSRQVLCVTHLPQVAAAADHQWQVTKHTVDGQVLSRVTLLDHERRVEEIARMLAGARVTEATRRHAAEMLGLAKERGRES